MWGDGVQLAFLSAAWLADAGSALRDKPRWLAENELHGELMEPYEAPQWTLTAALTPASHEKHSSSAHLLQI